MDREVDPDGTLNYQDQQQRHTCGLEGEQQNHQNDQNGHDGNHKIVLCEGKLEVLFYGGVANYIDIALREVIPRNSTNGIQERIGFITALG